MGAIRCSKCGEELLGAVNRCWRCGQAYTAPLEARVGASGGSPVVVSTTEPIDAIVVDAVANAEFSYEYAGPKRSPRMTTADMIDARRASMMAMGGTVTSLVLGVFSAIFAIFWPPAAIVAILGLAMGLWGLASPRRNLALVGMLLCCLAIGVGTYGIARNIFIAMQKNKALYFEESPAAPDN